MDKDAAVAAFSGMLADPGRLLTWHLVLMALTAGVVALGVHGGIGRASRILMPALGIFWR
ncbi:hypothetical protein [Accumulibacter sp.]|uniref:hypothetical protein n=1 Tax=Accumulibacter sp. TaxID=2053492 RepID=UPI002622341A|nr:hypothetical protein [Accumulibacter sp.]